VAGANVPVEELDPYKNQNKNTTSSPVTEGSHANDHTTEKQMSSSSSRTDERITGTTPKTDIKGSVEDEQNENHRVKTGMQTSTSSSGASENADQQDTVTEPMTNSNTEISDSATFPAWAIALIVIVPVLIIGAVTYFKVVHKRNASQKESSDTANEQDKEASSNLLQVALTFT
jgi:cobalamin biosynthesis Mg chelatase CobN